MGLATALLGARASVGTALGSPTPAPVTVAPTATASLTSTASPTPAPTPTPSPTLTPCAFADLECVVRPLTPSWSPSGATAIVEQRSAGGSTLIAVPLAGGPPTPLVQLRSGEWSVSPAGTTLALAVRSPDGRSRIAAVDLRAMRVSWVTPDEPGVAQTSPVWSLDSVVLYYTKISATDTTVDLGLFRIRANGTNGAQLRPPTERATLATGLTPDGRGVVVSKVLQGGSIDIVDLFGGPTRSYPSGGASVTFRANPRPRGLIVCCGPAGGPTQIAIWDDLNPAVTRTIVNGERVFGASWSPDGGAIVAALSPSVVSTVLPTLVRMDAAGGGRAAIAGTEGAANPTWLETGIVYQGGVAGNSAREIHFAPAPAGEPRTVFTASADILRWAVIEP